MTDQTKLFFTGFVQVLLVAINTWQVAHAKWIGVTIVGFLISYVWTWNVKKVAFGTHRDRVIYALGASLGTVCGLAVAMLWYEGL